MKDIKHTLSPAAIARRTSAGDHLDALTAALERRVAASIAVPETSALQLRPINRSDIDPLRPASLEEVIGQDRLKPLLHRLVEHVPAGGALAPMLLVGASGTGKTTLAMVVARELNSDIYALKAPVDMNTLNALRQQASDGNVVFIDEIHMQVSGDRRGLTAACDPESFYQLLEDGTLSTATGPLPFPKVSWIGATTDVGLLPEPLSARFPLQPQLAPYSLSDLETLATRNMTALGLLGGGYAANVFAQASRNNPRQLNAYVRSARALTSEGAISPELAIEVVTDLCSTTLDGLTKSMQTVLTFLFTRCRRDTRQGIVFSASVNTLATACGHGRDTKAIALLVEPYLLQRGLIEVRPQGRTLTPTGIERARQLTGGTPCPK
jgi:Holliday junction DNA helicase RuvB